MMNTHKLSKIVFNIVVYTALIIGLVIIVFPLYITVITAMKTTAESAQSFFSLPSSFYMENFKKVIEKAKFFVFLRNSSFITAVSLLGEMILVPAFAYAVSRSRGKPYFKIIYFMTIIGLFVPFQVVMLPTVKLFSRMHLLNITGVILLYLTYTLKKGVFLVVGYLDAIPLELEESAFMDGCTRFQIYRKIIFPLLGPILATLLIVDGLWIWNDFLLPLLILNRESSMWTLPLFLAQFKNEYAFDFNLAFASFLLTMIPIIIFYAFMQKNIMSGVTQGAIKS